jgi:RNA polymerase I-specific transcription initiation factor RRN6
MTDFESNRDSTYGDLGNGNYDTYEKSWEFPRKPRRRYNLRWLGQPEQLLHGTVLEDQRRSDYFERGKSIKHVAETCVSLTGFGNFYEKDLLVSETIARGLNCSDPFVGDLLCLGMIKSDFESRLTPVYVCPGSVFEQGLRIAQATFTRASFIHQQTQNDGLIIKLPTLTGDVSFWNKDASSVQQISFSAPSSSRSIGRLLAVRLPKSTVVLEISKRAYPIANQANGSINPYSNLDIQMKFELPFDDLPRARHSDISFNPWYRRQFAIIDEAGRWSIALLPKKPLTQKSSSIIPEYSSVLDPSSNEYKSRPENYSVGYFDPHEDGWVRIRWVSDIHTLVMCTRKQIQLINLKSGKIKCIDLLREKEIPWYVDLRVCRKATDQFFVLTYSHIFWIRIIQKGLAEDDSLVSYQVLLATQHHRDSLDNTLQLKTHEAEGCKCIL